ncbi:MAG: hypothetical protein V1872_03865 [bacterium]
MMKLKPTNPHKNSEEETTLQFKKNPFWNIVGMFDDGIDDGAIHHDRDIYGLEILLKQNILK